MRRERGRACEQLGDLPVGVGARLCGHLDLGAIRARLIDFGFVPETPVRVIRRAPLGGPVEVEIRGTRLCLRPTDLLGVCAVRDAEAP